MRKFRPLGVWTNADNPEDAQRARTYGAEGIGLCRTEHMFFDTLLLQIKEKAQMLKREVLSGNGKMAAK